MDKMGKLSLAFTAGAVGGVANVIFLYVVSVAGIVALLGINLPAPPLPAFLYKQIVWGGLWGLLLAAPILRQSWWLRGVVLGVLATLVALFVFMPQTPLGVAGLNAGPLMPVLALVANVVYGLVAAWWFRRTAAG